MEIKKILRHDIILWLVNMSELQEYTNAEIEESSKWAVEEFGYDPQLYGGSWLFDNKEDAIAFKLRWG